MDDITAFVVWAICIVIGAPLLLLGLFHLLFPETAWNKYRTWGKFWGNDPQEIAPNYKYSRAMRTVGIVLFIGGVFICLIGYYA